MSLWSLVQMMICLSYLVAFISLKQPTSVRMISGPNLLKHWKCHELFWSFWKIIDNKEARRRMGEKCFRVIQQSISFSIRWYQWHLQYDTQEMIHFMKLNASLFSTSKWTIGTKIGKKFKEFINSLFNPPEIAQALSRSSYLLKAFIHIHGLGPSYMCWISMPLAMRSMPTLDCQGWPYHTSHLHESQIVYVVQYIIS